MMARYSPLSGVWNIKSVYGDWYAWIYDRYVAKAVSRIGQQEVEAMALDPLQSGARLLDVGCGGAHRLIRNAKSRPDIRFAGIDSSPRQLAFARSRVRHWALTNVELRLGDVENIEFGEASFDAVLVMGSLKHWKDINRGLRECLRVLKPGGLILAMDSNRDTSLPECRKLVEQMQFPRMLRPLAFWHLRKYVIGQSMSLQEAGHYWSDLNLAEKTGPRLIPGCAAWIMWGKKRH